MHDKSASHTLWSYLNPRESVNNSTRDYFELSMPESEKTRQKSSTFFQETNLYC